MDAKIRHKHIVVPVTPGYKVLTAGSDVVGRVRKCGNDATIKHGINTNDRVASLVGCGGNAMFITLDANKLVRVPRQVPSVSAAIVIESYLPAFQALFMGAAEPEQRYSSTYFQNKNVLVFGGMSTVGQAVIELALLFGAKVYTTAITKHHDSLESFGAIPLEPDSKTWAFLIPGKLDIAVDPTSHEPDRNSFQALKMGGKYVSFGKGKNAEVSNWMAFSQMFVAPSMGTKPYTYNVFDEWDDNLEGSKSDLSYLFGLLKLGKLEPQLSGTMGLNKVADAHTFLDGKRRIQGTFVCLPWTGK